MNSAGFAGGTSVSRRRALGLLAGAGVAVVAGCSSTSRPAATGSPLPRRPTPSGTPSTPRTPDWRTLAARINGTVRRPDDAGYATAYRLFDPRFDRIRPQAVVTVGAADDVAQCIAFATRYGLPLSIRSGGHSYLGASTGTGLVIDLRSLTGVQRISAGQARVGAGTALVDAYSQLAAQSAAIPAGSCPSVGISGLTLGGGVGVLARGFGLTCDRLTAARIVTADGSILSCDHAQHPDLYWALRGGGGSFGVVTSLTYSLVPTPGLALSHGYVAWPWSSSTAAAVLSAWQHFATTAPDRLWSTCHLVTQSDRNAAPTLAVASVYVGSASTLDELLGPLVSAVPTAPTTRSVNDDSFEATMMLEAGCSDRTVAACHISGETPGGTLQRGAFVAGSAYFNDLIPSDGINAVVAAVQAHAADPSLSSGGVSFDILGGAIDRVGPGATAYAHRGALFNAQYSAGWPGNSNRPAARNLKSLQTLKSALAPYASGGAYPNYADGSLPDAPKAYWGDNLPRLIDIRQRYDPHGLFTQPQGVPLS